ncbi:hypothetical protein A4H97_11020 [Niastella yeongjuensis]|uniref:Uncharacterized protein n=1 Tax=Niastella yeongjuensis TaxID=354355 RepID=A0A1V9EFP9_9BACT|nr:hypothetical protein [Niastella yeongjuensis]OQP44881.1 hypothetical protein A4H97_11020 [Niastella yeongjuensis]SEP41641.1 hypothetical protein SAMN05660816_05894 [Niastella yeongjuensis]
MIPENYKALIVKLKQKTLNKETIWSKTSRNEEYKLVLDKGAITIDKWDSDSVSYIDISIINDRGDVIDRIQVSDGEELNDYNLLSELHAAAKRAYYKVDETIKSIFIELDSSKIIGKENAPSDDVDDLPF